MMYRFSSSGTTNRCAESVDVRRCSGNYLFLADTVQTGIQTSVTLAGPSVSVTPPLLSLVPVIGKITLNRNGSSITQLIVTNTGNIPATGTTQILLFGANDTTIAEGTLLLTSHSNNHFRPKAKVKIKLTANPWKRNWGRQR